MTMLDPTRRDVIAAAGAGLGAGLLPAAATAGSGAAPHHAPRARRVVQLFMAGAPSNLDLFDDKQQSVFTVDAVRESGSIMALRNAEGQKNFVVGARPNGGLLNILDHLGHTIVLMGADRETGSGGMALLNGRGIQTVQIGSDPTENGQVAVWDSSGTRRTATMP